MIAQLLPKGAIRHSIAAKSRRLAVVLSLFGLISCEHPETGLVQVKSFPLSTQVPSLISGPHGQPAIAYVQTEDSLDALRWATWSGSEWLPATEIVAVTNMLVNWADRPQVVFDEDGRGFAHWLEIDERGDFTYGISTTRSFDGGASWDGPSRPHRDTAVAEHGFGQWLTRPDGAVLVWLDGRDFDGHPDPAQARMELRAAEWPNGSDWEAEVVLDSSVCTCCPMDVARINSEAFDVVYRDRTLEEVRDFSMIRYHVEGANRQNDVAEGSGANQVAATWEPLGILHEDGWEIAACPVNGAAIESNEHGTMATWYTGAHDEAQILAAWRPAGQTSFGPTIRLDTRYPLGRVAMTQDQDGWLYAVWLETNETGGVDWVGMQWSATGQPLQPEVLMAASERRVGGFPSLLGLEDGALVAWTNPTPEPHVMTAVWKRQ